MKKLDLLVVVDPYPSRDRGDGGDGAQGRRLPAAGGDADGVRRLGDRVEPLDPVAREGDRPDVRVAHRSHDHVPARAEVRLRQGVRRQDQARRRARAAWTSRRWRTRCARSTAARGPSATPASRPSGCRRTCATMHVFDVKTLRAKGGKDAKTGYVLDGDYYGLPWPCYGTPELKHPGLAESLPHLAARDGRRRQLPRELRRRARRRQPARRRRLAFEGRRPHDRLSRVRPRAHEEARLVGRADRGREEGGRRQELEDRPLGRHPARRHEEPRLPSVRQRQGARGRLELPGSGAAAPRAAVQPAAGSDREVPDARRPEEPLAHAGAVQDACRTRTRTPSSSIRSS